MKVVIRHMLVKNGFHTISTAVSKILDQPRCKSRKMRPERARAPQLKKYVTYIFFFCPFFLKFLGFFPAVIFFLSSLLKQGVPLLIINLINIFNI